MMRHAHFHRLSKSINFPTLACLLHLFWKVLFYINLPYPMVNLATILSIWWLNWFVIIKINIFFQKYWILHNTLLNNVIHVSMSNSQMQNKNQLKLWIYAFLVCGVYLLKYIHNMIQESVNVPSADNEYIVSRCWIFYTSSKSVKILILTCIQVTCIHS